MRNYSFLFYKRFDCNVGTFPVIQNGYFLKIAESDFNFKFGNYVIPNSERKNSKLALSLQYLQKGMSTQQVSNLFFVLLER